LATDGGSCRRAEIRFEDLEDRLQRRNARKVQPLAGPLKLLGELTVEQRVEHDARRCLDVLQYSFELTAAPYQWMQMLDRPDLRILHPHGLGDRDRRLPAPPGNRAELLHRFACVEKKMLFTQGAAIRFTIPSLEPSLSTSGYGFPSISRTRGSPSIVGRSGS